MQKTTSKKTTAKGTKKPSSSKASSEKKAEKKSVKKTKGEKLKLEKIPKMPPKPKSEGKLTKLTLEQKLKAEITSLNVSIRNLEEEHNVELELRDNVIKDLQEKINCWKSCVEQNRDALNTQYILVDKLESQIGEFENLNWFQRLFWKKD